MAVNCSVFPITTNGLDGVSASDSSTAGLTVSTVEPVIPSSVALIVVGPCPTPVARPCDPEVLEMVATDVAVDAQVTWLVRFSVELSEKVPTAVN